MFGTGLFTANASTLVAPAPSDQARLGYYAAMTQRERIEANLKRRMTNGEIAFVSRLGRTVYA